MLQRNACSLLKQFCWILFAVSMTGLVACGGGDKVKDFVDVPDVTLTSLEVVEGGELYFEENPVYEFLSDNTGPYTVVLADDDAASISLRASLSDPENNDLSFVRVAQGENRSDIVIPAASGTATSVELSPGTNLIYVRVRNREVAAVSNYSLSAYRTSNTAELANVYIDNADLLRVTSFNGITLLPPNERFDPELFEYSVQVAGSKCGVSVLPHPKSRQSSVEVNGEVTKLFEATFFPLEPGEVQEVLIHVTAEDAVTEIDYHFELERNALTSDEQQVNANIKTIEFASGIESNPFRCDVLQFAQLYNNDETGVTLTVVADNSNATMTIGNAVLDDDGDLVVDEDNSDLLAVENAVDLPSGEPFTHEILSNLEEGDNLFVITVTAANGETKKSYLFNAVRSENRNILVSNAEELQAALLDAQPNDEIIMLEGDYLGVAGEETSGHAEAHFYSNASGLPATEDELSKPIVLRALTSGVNLLGDDQSVNAVLRLEGDYWDLSEFTVSGAQNGIVLNGANNNLVFDINIREVGERGLVLQNGSSNNAMRRLIIDRTGQMLQTRDGIDEMYGEAIVIGEGEPAAENNALRYIRFYQNILTEALDIKANAVNTEVQFSSFTAHNIAEVPQANRSWVNIAGTGEMLFSYNDFHYEYYSQGTNPINVAVNVTGDETAQLELYQNKLFLDDVAIPFASVSSTAQVKVADNVRIDSGSLTYTGTVDQTFTTPIYQIQSIFDDSKCIARRDFVLTSETESETNSLAMMADCADVDTQKWQIHLDEQGAVLLTPAGSPEIKMAPGFLLQPISNDLEARFEVVSTRADVLEPPADVFNSSYSLRWLMSFENGLVSFINKGTGRYLTEVDYDWTETDYTPSTEDNLLVTQNLGIGTAQVFRLIRQE